MNGVYDVPELKQFMFELEAKDSFDYNDLIITTGRCRKCRQHVDIRDYDPTQKLCDLCKELKNQSRGNHEINQHR